jgi:hypothetical protein
MRPCRLILSLFLALGFAVPAAAQADRVQVVFVDPEKFSDVRDGYTQTESARTFFLDGIRRHIQQRAAARLGEGETFRVTITDVHLAGDYQARTPNITNVRIVREVMPARIDLGFRLARADGTVVAAGERRLRSTGYPVGVGIDPSDPLVYEKVLLDDWLREDLPRGRP